jgi:ABC-2 type transport system ATP-binding protein
VCQPVVELKNVYKKIGQKTLIDNLSFSIESGEVFGFLGPNGAGKTTTIRMMVGLMKPTQGAIFIKGEDLLTHFEKAIQHVGAIVENPELYAFLTGYQNLVHFSRMIGPTNYERIQEVTQLVGLDSVIHQKVKTYSLGMRQRLGVAQALLHQPSVLILDEPTNGLDPAGIREFRQLLRQLAHKENVAVLISSHLLSEIELMCDRVGIIQKGTLIGIESVSDFVQNGQGVSVRFSVDQLEKAKGIIASFEVPFSIEEDALLLTLEREDIPTWVERFTNEKVKIYAIQPLTKTLEDRFLEVTEGRSIE